jgi:hypothetical protein
MNTTFFDLLDVCVLIYLDDILIFSKSVEEHEAHLKLVFERLSAHKMHVKESKCALLLESVEFLGHTISADGVSIEVGKVEAVENWPAPTNVNEV